MDKPPSALGKKVAGSVVEGLYLWHKTLSEERAEFGPMLAKILGVSIKILDDIPEDPVRALLMHHMLFRKNPRRHAAILCIASAHKRIFEGNPPLYEDPDEMRAIRNWIVAVLRIRINKKRDSVPIAPKSVENFVKNNYIPLSLLMDDLEIFCGKQ